jgi:hypothetical protein
VAIPADILLTRGKSTDQGTPGILTGDRLSLCTLELPWRNNAPGISCIPAGRYVCRPYSSGKFPDAWEVADVPGRSAILIHIGNYAGDTAKGYRSDVQGCILVGLTLGEINGQQALLSSRLAMDALQAAVGRKPFTLVIADNAGTSE